MTIITRSGLLALFACILAACTPNPTVPPATAQDVSTPTPISQTPTFTATIPPAITQAITQAINPTMTQPETPFRIVGYATEAAVVEILQLEKLTHINYAFLIPRADGTFERLLNPWKLQNLVQAAHASGAQVLISVGGWGWDEQFETLASSPETRAVFVQTLVQFVSQYNLDGADIDWEFPDAGPSSQNFLALMSELRQALPDKLLTSAVVALGEHGESIPNESLALMDFVNIMAYDGDGENHSSMEYAQQALDYWLGRGLPPGKAVLGVPFYARPNGTPYSRIVKADSQAAYTDYYDYFGVKLNYNGIPTIQKKTELAKQRASGVMIWTLEQDSTDASSLLGAIYQAAKGKELP